MNAERLLQHYEQIVDAPDAIARLRRFILDLAVRGKLVPQDPADEPAMVLSTKIRLERQRRTDLESLRPAKRLKFGDEHAFAFAAPNGWRWVPANDVWEFENGDRSKNYPSRDHFVPTGVPFVNAGHLVGGSVSFDDMNYITEEKYHKLSGGKLRRGDQIYCLRGSLGKHAVYDCERPAAIASSLVILRPILAELVPYLRVYLSSDVSLMMLRRFDNGTAQPNLSSANLRLFEIPLPPLAEQHRIVAKVDELMALCDELEAARTEREAKRDRLAAASLARLNTPDPETFRDDARFALDALPALTARPDQIKQLRQTILNLAVCGKLVPQDPADEPAEELLKRLTAAQSAACRNEGLRARAPVKKLGRSDLWFDVPDDWVLSSFDDLFVIVSGVTKGQKVSPSEAADAPYLRVANVQRGHLDLAVIKTISVRRSDVERYALRHGDVLMTEGGDWDKLGRAAIWREEIPNCIHQNHIFRVRPPSTDVSSAWIITYVNSHLGRAFFENASKQTTNLASINMTQLRACPFPLPPLAEQHRIVAKVDELMALCDQLETSLGSADETRKKLLDSMLAEALAPVEAETLLKAAE